MPNADFNADVIKRLWGTVPIEDIVLATGVSVSDIIFIVMPEIRKVDLDEKKKKFIFELANRLSRKIKLFEFDGKLYFDYTDEIDEELVLLIEEKLSNVSYDNILLMFREFDELFSLVNMGGCSSREDILCMVDNAIAAKRGRCLKKEFK